MAPRSLPLAGRAGVRRTCAGACLVALLAGCGGGSATSPRKSHLHGTVMRGPTSPVCRKGTPCSEPASGAMLSFALVGPGHMQTITVGGVAGAVGVGALVAKNGTYSVSLAPGIYTVNWVYLSAVPRRVGRGIEPSTVIVVAGQNRRLDFQIDTGIR